MSEKPAPDGFLTRTLARPMLLSMLLASSAWAQSVTPVLLYVHPASFEIGDRSFSSPAELQAFLSERRPQKIQVVPAQDAEYEQVRRAMAAIQNAGVTDIGLTGRVAPVDSSPEKPVAPRDRPPAPAR